jgi:haloacetate dehalogenase
VFEDFAEFDVAVSGTTIHGRRGGQGPPLLLPHGIPETHLMWHRAAPMLADAYSVASSPATDQCHGRPGRPFHEGC